MAFSGPPPQNFCLHHANFTSEKAVACDPSIKLDQMRDFQKYFRGEEKEKLSDFVKDVQEHPTMLMF